MTAAAMLVCVIDPAIGARVAGLVLPSSLGRTPSRPRAKK
jgi:hypothetical protein